MTQLRIFIWSAAAAAATCHGRLAEAAPGGMDMVCATLHCGLQIGACALNAQCRSALACAAACPTPEKDKSPGKIDYQNCTLGCSYSYGFHNNAYENAMTCLNTNGCLTLPVINDPATDPFFNKCAPDPQVRPKRPLHIDDLKTSADNGWWAAIGFHPIYDCAWPCQYASMYPGQAGEFIWDLHMQVRLVNYSIMPIHEKWPFPAQPGARFWLNHTDLGMLHYEHWWLLDKAADSSWVSLYYCGGTGSWKYSGGILFSKTRSLTTAQRAHIKESYKQSVGLDVDTQGCTFDNSKCPHWTSPSSILLV
jgi:hypothetical protein